MPHYAISGFQRPGGAGVSWNLKTAIVAASSPDEAKGLLSKALESEPWGIIRNDGRHHTWVIAEAEPVTSFPYSTIVIQQRPLLLPDLYPEEMASIDAIRERSAASGVHLATYMALDDGDDIAIELTA